MRQMFDISDESFKDIFGNESFYLPIRWDGVDFCRTLDELFHHYNDVLKRNLNSEEMQILEARGLNNALLLLSSSVEEYLNGLPEKAFSSFKKLMGILNKTPLVVSQSIELKGGVIEEKQTEIPRLFRAVKVEDNKPYERERLFHTPYSLRSKISTNRYSIAGYPSLYLSTSLMLCCNEIHADPSRDLVLASAFEPANEKTAHGIRIIELGIKPQDFFASNKEESYGRRVPKGVLSSKEIEFTYLLWYPLIAASSFIRVSKETPFAAEYIIPQLIMQWVRSERALWTGRHYYPQVNGIRYFSCASIKASEMGFNYVFPTLGWTRYYKGKFCPYLKKTFKLTKPVYIHEYNSIEECEDYLQKARNLCFIQ